MGLGDAVKQNLSEMAGNIAKARIEILEVTPTDTTMESPVTVKSGGSTFGGYVDSMRGVAESAVNAKVNDVLQSAGMAETLAALGSDKVKKKIFEVQFNPSELNFIGSGGGRMAKNNYTEKKDGARTNELTFESMQVRIELHARLIFDQVDPQDAFMADKLTTSPTAVTEGIIKAVRTAKDSKKPCSVQTQVEAFIGALRSPNTRQVIFNWGDMSYSGILNKVVAEYVMFNVVGAPVRAFVNLSIVCADGGDEYSNMGAWYTAYKNAFGGSKSYVKDGQKKGNLLNLNY